MGKISGLCLSLLLGSLTILVGCSGTSSAPLTPPATFQVLTVSDLHFNPFYDPSLISALMAHDASDWKGIFEGSGVTAPSQYGADTNYPLLVVTLASMTQNLGSSPVVLFTGDVLGHGIPEAFCAVYNHAPINNCPPLGAEGTTAMEQFVDKTYAFVAIQIRASLGTVPVIIVPGNIDTYDSASAGPDTDFLIRNSTTVYTQFLLHSVNQTTFQHSFTTLGSYSAQPLGLQLRVLAIDSNPLAKGSPLNPDDELTWLDTELAAAQTAGQRVWLLMHVPPGANTTGTAQNAAQTNPPGQVNATDTEMMWQDTYLSQFLHILTKYPGVISMMVGGHTHMDEYRVMPSGEVMYGLPGISPCFGNNPAFKIFSVRQDTLAPTDYVSLDYNLVTHPRQFQNSYRFSAAYGADPNASLQSSSQQLSAQFVQSDTKRSIYSGNYVSGSTGLNPKTNASWNPITDANWPIFGCGISQNDKDNYVTCVNTY